MRALRGPPQHEGSRHGPNRDGLDLNSILAGAEVQFDNKTYIELQVWARHLLRAVEGFQHRQLRRAEGERAAVAAARKAVRA